MKEYEKKDMFFKAPDQNDWNGVNTVKALVGDILFPYLKVGVIDQDVEKNDQSITHSFRCGTQDHIKNIKRRSRRSDKKIKGNFPNLIRENFYGGSFGKDEDRESCLREKKLHNYRRL